MKQKCSKCANEYESEKTDGVCPACLEEMVVNPTSEPVEELPLTSGQAFAGLEVAELIGRGGMGVVYKARQSRLNRDVAVKVMPRKLSADPEFRARFQREASALAGLTHPNIVAIHDYGTEGEYTYLVMELVDGVNLRDLLRERKLSPAEALKIVPQLCDALEYAHGEGIVHRDIKPENLLIDKRGRVKIADFGLAKLVGDARTKLAALTQSNVSMGTPHYMAPEQLENPKEVDHRADIYSMGVVFYEMLTGELPIGRFAPPSRRVEVDVRLDEVVLKALEKSPEERYQKASQVRDAVTKITAAPGNKRTITLGRISFVAMVWSPIAGILLGAGIVHLINRPPAHPPTPFANFRRTDASSAESDKRISINMKDVEIKSVVELIARVSGKNIIVHNEVMGWTTLSVNDIPWRTALDAVVKSAAVPCEIVEEPGDILRITPSKPVISVRAATPPENLEQAVTVHKELTWEDLSVEQCKTFPSGFYRTAPADLIARGIGVSRNPTQLRREDALRLWSEVDKSAKTVNIPLEAYEVAYLSDSYATPSSAILLFKGADATPCKDLATAVQGALGPSGQCTSGQAGLFGWVIATAGSGASSPSAGARTEALNRFMQERASSPIPRLTVKCQGAPIHALLEVIARKLGMGFTLNVESTGRVTVDLKQIPWPIALQEIVDTTSGLFCEANGSLLKLGRLPTPPK